MSLWRYIKVTSSPMAIITLPTMWMAETTAHEHSHFDMINSDRQINVCSLRYYRKWLKCKLPAPFDWFFVIVSIKDFVSHRNIHNSELLFPYLFIVEFLYNDGHKGIFRQGICLTTLYRSLSSALGIFIFCIFCWHQRRFYSYAWSCFKVIINGIQPDIYFRMIWHRLLLLLFQQRDKKFIFELNL